RAIRESWEKAKGEVAAVKARVDGTVRVAAIYSVGLHDVSRHMQRFMSLYPEARVQLECLHPHKVVEAVLGGEADVGIMSYPPTNRALSIVPLRAEPMAFVCHPNHRLARHRLVRPTGIIHRRQKPLTPTVSRFIELLREANEEPARARAGLAARRGVGLERGSFGKEGESHG